jgi:beta-lactamase class A
LHLPNRRQFTLGLAALPASAVFEHAQGISTELAELESGSGGRLGVCVLDAGGRVLAQHRSEERFMFCSTFKVYLAGAVLAAADQRRERLDHQVPVSRADLVPYAPVVEKALAAGRMTVEALARGTVTLSDNAAANLLLRRIGGPAGLTRYLRSLGGRQARLDRFEPDLNRRNGQLDTTTPLDAALMLRNLLTPSALRPRSLARLETWLIESPTGRARLRAGLPSEWRTGDKTGTGPAGEANDVAFVDLPSGGRLFIAGYFEAATNSPQQREQVLAAVGRLVTENWFRNA